nr:hypothetical protein [Tanacetum cinerariifolium]
YGQVVDSFIPSRVSKEGKKSDFVRFIKSFNDKPVMVIGEECFADKNLDFTLVAKVKNFESIPNLRVICKKEGFENLTIRYLGVEDRVIWVDVEGIPFVAWTHNTFKKIASKWGELLFVKDLNDNNLWRKRMYVITKIEEFIMETFKKFIKGTMSMIRAREIIGWNPEFILDDDVSISEGKDSEDSGSFVDIFSGVQGQEDANLFNEKNHIVNNEEKSADPFNIYGFRNVVEEVNNENSKGDNEVNGVECPQSNNSVTHEGARSVEENHHSKLNNGRHHMASNSRVDSSLPKGQCPQGVWNASNSRLLMIGVYASQEISEKRMLWNYLQGVINRWHGELLKDARKMRKLDRFLVSEGILCQFPGLLGSVLSKHLSDHRPIMLKETSTDYGPIPCKLYHSWLSNESFELLVLLKHKIKSWVHQNRILDNAKRKDVVKNLESIDKQIDQHGGLKDLLTSRRDLWKKLTDIDVNNGKDLAQKAKVKWAIEGDESSKFFHGIVNKKGNKWLLEAFLLMKFFRGVDVDSRKLSWFSWDKVIAGKEVGGLGMYSFYVMNRYLLFKWIWRFKTNPDALWALIIKAIHEKWIECGILKEKFPQLFALEINKQATVFDKLQVGVLSSFRRDPKGGAECTKMEELLSLINSVEFSAEPDIWNWSLSSDGIFSVSSARIHVDEGLCIMEGPHTRWHNMSLRGLDIPSISCPVCLVGVKTYDHLLFSCSTTSYIIAHILVWWELPFIELSSFLDWKSWFDGLKLKHELKAFIEATFFCLMVGYIEFLK